MMLPTTAPRTKNARVKRLARPVTVSEPFGGRNHASVAARQPAWIRKLFDPLTSSGRPDGLRDSMLASHPADEIFEKMRRGRRGKEFTRIYRLEWRSRSMNDQAEAPSILHESPVIVFVNSAPGRGRARSFLGRVQKLFDSFHVHVQFAMPKSAAELESSVQNVISQGQRVLFAMGGDGTFQALATAAFGAEALFGILPIGGGNDFAAALGLPDDPVKAAEAILRGTPRFVDLVKVRTAEGRTRLYAGGGGVGLDAEAARYANVAYRRFPG